MTRLLKMILGSKYPEFEEKILLRSLEDLCDQEKLSRETFQKLCFGLEKGSVPVREELLDYQTRTNRDGGALIQAVLELPDEVSLSTFVKVHNDDSRFKAEVQATQELSTVLKSPHVLPIRFLDRSNLVLATPFVKGTRAYDVYKENPQDQDVILNKCVTALFDTYRRSAASFSWTDAFPTPTSITKSVRTHGFDRLAQKKMDRSFAKLEQEYACTVGAYLFRSPLTLLHGDPHLGNFMLSDQTYLVDWENRRPGMIHSDLYKLILRSEPDDGTKKKIVRDFADFSRQSLDPRVSPKEFMEQFDHAIVHEHLFIAGALRSLSRSVSGAESVHLRNGSDLYFTKAVGQSGSLGHEKLTTMLLDFADQQGIRIVDDCDREQMESQYSLSKNGFSTLLETSKPTQRDAIASLESSVLKKRRRSGFKRVASAAGTFMAMVGLSAGIARFENRPPILYSSIPSQERIAEEAFVWDSVINGGIGEQQRTLDNHPEVKPYTHGGYFWCTKWGDLTDRSKLEGKKITFSIEDHLSLWKGRLDIHKEHKPGPCSLIDIYSSKYGLPDSIVESLFYTNEYVLKKSESDGVMRDQVTGLPTWVLGELSKKNPDSLTFEEKVDLSVGYFRKLLEKRRFKVFDAITLYYCGEDALSKATSQSYQRFRETSKEKNQFDFPYAEHFLNYCEFLPKECKPLVFSAAAGAHERWGETFGDFGFMPRDWELYSKINDYSKPPSPSPSASR